MFCIVDLIYEKKGALKVATMFALIREQVTVNLYTPGFKYKHILHGK